MPLSQVIGKKAIVVLIYKGVINRRTKLQTSQFNLSVLQADETHYSIIPEETLG
jgi:hypothetical protein